MNLEYLIGEMSPSRIDCANKCMAQFRFRYVERLPEVTSSALAFGRTADETGNDVYREKMKSGSTPSAEDAAERFASHWDFIGDAVEDWEDGETKGQLLDEGVKGIRRWRDHFAAHLQPTHVQEMIKAPVIDPRTGDQFTLVGVLDVRGVIEKAARKVVADMKTSKRRYGADKVVRGTQPVAYTLLTQVPTFEFHVIVRTKEPSTQLFRAAIADSDRDAFLRRTGILRRNIAHAFTTGDWLPNRAHQMCSRRYCSFWDRCEKEYGGRVAP